MSALIPQDPLTALNPLRKIGPQIVDPLRRIHGWSAIIARDRALERGGHVLFAQHAEDRDGIGGRDQRAEHETIGQRDR